ncbi:alpha/beta hydrolase [Sphingomonas sp. Leaf357]|uniref:alpha/beta fold hydrolase n=1 Tax=Sphingomonas sp. Leaf357 TaxID=1736350 RepID=UPI0007011934|nr:alpha/beta fold hydrolase [Sphingomonas sp. Leaf357]KQS03505.1 alpha/beta hydrolase [Sphingomonas sp. Leaf357]
MKARANGIELEYESFGDDAAPAVLLIMGLGAQLTRWPMPFVEALVARGYRVIRYDNRDIGLSQKLDSAGVPSIAGLLVARLFRYRPRVPYLLDDMAADAAGLLDALGIERAHIIGASMGGMIAQMFAAAYPERTRTLMSIMSSTGNPALPAADREAMAVLTKRPKTKDLDAIIAFGVRAEKTIGSPGYPVDDAVVRANVTRDVTRSMSPAGFARQMAAIVASGDRRKALATITAPTLVLHGTDDPLVPIAAGRDTAKTIPGATMVEVPGMGHNMPDALIPVVVEAFEGLVARAGVRV